MVFINNWLCLCQMLEKSAEFCFHMCVCIAITKNINNYGLSMKISFFIFKLLLLYTFTFALNFLKFVLLLNWHMMFGFLYINCYIQLITVLFQNLCLWQDHNRNQLTALRYIVMVQNCWFELATTIFLSAIYTGLNYI